MSHSQFVKIDSHAHLTSDELYEDIDDIMKRAKEQNVCAVININTDKITYERALEYKNKRTDFFNAGATTPHDVEEEGELYFSLFEAAAQNGDLVAVGETGLDYYYEHSNRSVQQEFLLRYVDLATRVDLPIIIHCRGEEAFRDLFRLTKTCSQPFVLHCFTGTERDVREAIERGWMISISGIATFKRSEELRKVITHIPKENLLIETDAPYLAPQSKRGKVNEPAYIGETLQVISQVLEETEETISKATTENALKFFRLSKEVIANNPA